MYFTAGAAELGNPRKDTGDVPFRRLVAASIAMAACGSGTPSSSSSATELLNQALTLLGSAPAIQVTDTCVGDCAGTGSDVIVGAGQCGERAYLVAQIRHDFVEGVDRLGTRQVNGHAVLRLVPRGSHGDNGEGLNSGDELDVAADGAPYPVLWYQPADRWADTETFTVLTSPPPSPRPDELFCSFLATPTPTAPTPTGTLHVSASGSVTLEKTMAVRCDIAGHVVGAYPLSSSEVATLQIVGIAVGSTVGRTGAGQRSDVVDLYVLPPNTSPYRRSYYTGPAQLTTKTTKPWTGTFTADVTADQPPAPAAGPSLHVSGDFTCPPGG